MQPLTSRDFAEVSFSQAREKWLSISGHMDESEALDLACALVAAFPRRPFFISRAMDLAARQDRKLQVARVIMDAAEREDGTPVGPIIRATDIIVQSDDVAEAERRHAEQLRERFTEASPRRHLFRALAANRAHDPDLARREVARHLADFPDDKPALALRGALAYRSGRWGRYCNDILALQAVEGNAQSERFLDLFERFRAARGLSGMPPEEMARNDEMLETPGAVYEHAMKIAPAPDGGTRHGVIMLTGSLGGGGAERIVATAFRRFRELEHVEDTRLWLFSKIARHGGNALFYLPLTGLSEDELTVIQPAEDQEEPFCWLPPFYATRAQSIYDALIRERPRVLYVALDEAIIAAGIAAVMAGVPEIIVHCHNMSPPNLHGDSARSFGWDRAYRALLSRPNVRYVNVAQAAVDDYLEWCQIPPGACRATVIHNGVDFSAIDSALTDDLPGRIRSELQIPDGSPIVGAAIRFAEVKQPFTWLDTARLIRDAVPDAHFILYGDGELFEDAKAYAARLGLDDCAHFPGRVSDLAHRLPVFDVLMLSSRSEGFPNSLVEAQAAGVVPVAFDVGGCREAMDPGRTGLVIPARTATALAEEVAALLEDRRRLDTMAQEGMTFVRETFTFDRMFTAMHDLVYRERQCTPPSIWNRIHDAWRRIGN